MSGWQDAAARILDAAMRHFGEDVSFEPASGGTSVVRGIFRSAHVRADLASETGVQTSGPVIGLQLSTLSSEPTEGDAFRIRGSLYRVTTLERDGEGGAYAHLARVA